MRLYGRRQLESKRFHARSAARAQRGTILPHANDLPGIIATLERELHTSLRSPEERQEVYSTYAVTNVFDLYFNLHPEMTKKSKAPVASTVTTYSPSYSKPKRTHRF